MITLKAQTASREGATHICTACTHCQIQYQGKEAAHILSKNNLSTVPYPLFLGTALGIDTCQDRLKIFYGKKNGSN
jgi:heterodisulfide reductase subunit B